MNTLAVHNTRSLKLECTATLSLDLAKSIDWITQRVYYSSQVGIANWNGEHLTGAVNLHALFNAGELTEDNNTDLVLIQV